MNAAERRLYDDIDALVNDVYAGAPGVNSTALGFVMTTYRKRLGSSPRAFAQTCRNHLQREQASATAWREIAQLDADEQEDFSDDQLPDAVLTPKAVARLEQAARDAGLLERRDTKLRQLQKSLTELDADGHRKIIILYPVPGHHVVLGRPAGTARPPQHYLHLRSRRTDAGRPWTAHQGAARRYLLAC